MSESLDVAVGLCPWVDLMQQINHTISLLRNRLWCPPNYVRAYVEVEYFDAARAVVGDDLVNAFFERVFEDVQ